MIQVLLSAYNGERFIREQLDSLLNQTVKDVRILIRDDGSSDSTREILQEYCDRYSNICCYFGENKGVRDSFFDLFAHVEEQADFIAACDQDDVWFPDKLETAVKMLKQISGPALYCGRTLLTDEQLHPLEDKIRNSQPRPSYGNALIENICTGCTMVINRELYLLTKDKWPQKSLIHDWWFYQAASCFGTVIYDNEPHIYYRQHGGNVIGLDAGRFALVRRQLKSFLRFRGTFTAQAEEFLETFSPGGEKLYLTELMIGTRKQLSSRFKILFEKRIYRQGKADQLLFKFMLFAGWL